MFTLYNTLSRKKEVFEPLVPGRVGMYVCGPTVYGPPHLGHARSAITFDILFRYLLHLGYKVRYVRNITDVGHLEHDADEGEDKIALRARLEQLEPMEVAHTYTEAFHDAMRRLNVLSPSIEPHASGHIIEQISLVQQILDAGYAYVANGSVYFDVEKYAAEHNYGALSGRRIDDLLEGTRALDGSGDKKSPLDFALWKRASPEHIMRWPSPWSEGFPGWHAECSAMSVRYLGETFDIHGGGMDLMFPHHEAEMAQCTAAGDRGARYWVHNNMVTTGGQKMGKSLGNAVALDDFDGMTVRFFMLQAHYRSTLDFSFEALEAAQKGLERLLKAVETLDTQVVRQAHQPAGQPPELVEGPDLEARLKEAMDDDLNTPIVIAHLFDAARELNRGDLSADDAARLRELMRVWVFDILGLRDERAGTESALEPVMEMVLQLRAEAKEAKNWELSDRIRDGLAAAGIKVMDTKDGKSEWQLQ